METKFYRQCFLEKKSGSSTWQQVSYIPEKFAVVGKVLKLRNDDGVWDDGWIVKSTGELRDAKIVEQESRMYPKNRKASDMLRGERTSQE